MLTAMQQAVPSQAVPCEVHSEVPSRFDPRERVRCPLLMVCLNRSVVDFDPLRVLPVPFLLLSFHV